MQQDQFFWLLMLKVYAVVGVLSVLICAFVWFLSAGFG
jgi:hypothetical protein